MTRLHSSNPTSSWKSAKNKRSLGRRDFYVYYVPHKRVLHAQTGTAAAAIVRKLCDALPSSKSMPTRTAAILQRLWNFEPTIAQEAVHNMIAPRAWRLGDFNRTELDPTVDDLRSIGEITWSRLNDQSYLPPDLQAKL